ncbi:hypothetical protein D3C87_1721370 [compost metagenome]
MGEAVGEPGVVRRIAIAEARIVRRDHPVAIGKQRDEVAEHVRRRGKAVQEKHDRRILAAGLAIKDLDAVHRGVTVMDDGGCGARSGDHVGGSCSARKRRETGKRQSKGDHKSIHFTSPSG